MVGQNAPIAKKLALPHGKRLVTLYDLKLIDNTTSRVNFFPANASRNDVDNNYVTNPLPGNKPTAILGVSLEATLQVIRKTADIDPVKVINALKDASIKITTDQNDQRMILARLEDFFNFKSTGYHVAASEGAANAQVVVDAVELRSNGVIRLADPFQIGAGQNFNVEVIFNSASLFPTAANWTSAGYGRFGLVTKLYTAD